MKAPVILDDIWLAKWRLMTNAELDEENRTLTDKMYASQNTKIHAQLQAALMLLTDYRSRQ